MTDPSLLKAVTDKVKTTKPVTAKQSKKYSPKELTQTIQPPSKQKVQTMTLQLVTEKQTDSVKHSQSEWHNSSQIDYPVTNQLSSD